MKTNSSPTPARPLSLSRLEALAPPICNSRRWHPAINFFSFTKAINQIYLIFIKYIWINLDTSTLLLSAIACLQKTGKFQQWTRRGASLVLLAANDVAILFIEKWQRQCIRECACTFSDALPLSLTRSFFAAVIAAVIAAVMTAAMTAALFCRGHCRCHDRSNDSGNDSVTASRLTLPCISM